jgi:hypothetical protein
MVSIDTSLEIRTKMSRNMHKGLHDISCSVESLANMTKLGATTV